MYSHYEYVHIIFFSTQELLTGVAKIYFLFCFSLGYYLSSAKASDPKPLFAFIL